MAVALIQSDACPHGAGLVCLQADHSSLEVKAQRMRFGMVGVRNGDGKFQLITDGKPLVGDQVEPGCGGVAGGASAMAHAYRQRDDESLRLATLETEAACWHHTNQSRRGTRAPQLSAR